ncbi:hypothetical protein QTP70_034629 [Hemibagrus guttatus]|uniref:SUEL-type lectin domain-containing protein n=1 Tax=Hemibagrus guttatus TaxID=175788 RepID=A0AAE0R3U9_9TELE|nr:hypothetical protein QTP70_034629 [Hemibagrus guttatus]
MMLLKLTLFTLFVAFQDLHVSGGHRHIKIIRAFYGRIDSITCAAGRPANQICNRHCFLANAHYIVSSRCNGRCYCHVPVKTSVLPDPCYGTYKYLQIAYYCV